MQADDRLRELVDQVAPAIPKPTADQHDSARAALHRAMTAESKPPRALWRRPGFAWAAAATATAVVVGVLAVPSSTPPVDANLAGIARAARTLTVDQLPEGSYLFVHLETVSRNIEAVDGSELVYLLVESVDRWIKGTDQQEIRTIEPPRFLNPGDSEAYYASDQPGIDGVGETSIVVAGTVPNAEAIAGLSTDADTLREQVYAELEQDPDWNAGDESRKIEVLAEKMSPELNVSPQLRGALLELLGELDVVSVMLSDGGVLVSHEYTEPGTGEWLQELEFDSTGHLRVNRLTLVEPGPAVDQPAGLFSETVYSEQDVVSGPGVYPQK